MCSFKIETQKVTIEIDKSFCGSSGGGLLEKIPLTARGKGVKNAI